ncbi:MAG TPA: single-stranded-DNA-specific exonuclease RecJ [Phycisphaerae bacterium]|nr:single-stranded-DNA-specific exonuclease RecJ [Phycisphaerae bacterium]HPS53155.1 single-stranded-DNA-specific exonuclease RecJ [Phycisphaerae bacterium]
MDCFEPRYRWEISEPWPQAAELAERLAVSPVIAQILHNRGIDDELSAKRFLSPKWSDLLDPHELGGCEQAAKVIAAAVRAGKRMVIYGDYDVDGITAITILHNCLKHAGADVGYYVPNRLEEGYGVNSAALGELIDGGAELIITVDCGISASANFAEFAGRADFVVTDHHSLSDAVPDISAVVHPAVNGYSNPSLCGAGVAMKLAWQIARELEGVDRVSRHMRTMLINATALAALGTVADVVPLVGENRTIAVLGLLAVASTEHVGLRAMVNAFSSGGPLSVRDIGFGLAPRINAAGRMGHASNAIEMLLTDSPQVAVKITRELDELNEQRKIVEKDITSQAIEMVHAAGMDGDDCRAIVLSSEDWHNGVIGIVASRLVDRFNKPAVMIAFDSNNRGQGSARSIDGYHLADALHACGEFLISSGGHAKAAGLRIEKSQIADFTRVFLAHAAANISCKELKPAVKVDVESVLAELCHMNTAAVFEKMAPFGAGNNQPLVLVRGCKIACPPKRMGKTGTTLNLMLRQGQRGPVMRCVGFGMGGYADVLQGVRDVDVLVTPVINRFNGNLTVELQLKDISPAVN